MPYPKRAFPPGSPRLSGGASLNDAPLTVEDWRIVHHGYVAFMTLVRRVAAEAYAREDKRRSRPPATVAEGDERGGA